jgi:hypothetical protein
MLLRRGRGASTSVPPEVDSIGDSSRGKPPAREAIVNELQHHPPTSSDTSREALRVQFAALRRIAPAQRLALMDDLTRLAQSISREGLRRRNPKASEGELDILFSELVLGKQLAALVLEHRRSLATREAP